MTDNENKLKQLRERTMPEFKSRDEFYAYAAEHNVPNLSRDEAYKHICDNLLPVFKVAKELCEHIGGDKDYFKKRSLQEIGSMAIASRMIKTVDKNCTSDTDKEKGLFFLTHSISHSFHDSKRQDIDALSVEENKGFCKLISDHIFHYDHVNRYLGGFSEAVIGDDSCCTIKGNVTDWEALKDSFFVQVVTEPLFIDELNKLCKERGVEWKNNDKLYPAARDNIQTKIDEFCDMKQAQFMKQMQKSNTEVKG